MLVKWTSARTEVKSDILIIEYSPFGYNVSKCLLSMCVWIFFQFLTCDMKLIILCLKHVLIHNYS